MRIFDPTVSGSMALSGSLTVQGPTTIVGTLTNNGAQINTAGLALANYYNFI